MYELWAASCPECGTEVLIPSDAPNQIARSQKGGRKFMNVTCPGCRLVTRYTRSRLYTCMCDSDPYGPDSLETWIAVLLECTVEDCRWCVVETWIYKGISTSDLGNYFVPTWRIPGIKCYKGHPAKSPPKLLWDFRDY